MASFKIGAIPEGEKFIERGADVLKSLDPALSKRGWEMDIRNVMPQWERASAPFVRNCADLNSNVIRADVWPPNVICEGEESVGLVDFDDCLHGATIIHVAIALMEFSMFQDIVMDEELAVAFLANYFRHGGRMSPLEEKLIADVMEMTCAMWLAYNVIQAPTFEEAEIYLRRLDLLHDDTFREKMSTDVRRFIRIARALL